MDGSHFANTIQEILVTIREIRIWREGVNTRLENLEQTQHDQQERVDNLETGALLVKEEQAEIGKKITALTYRIEKSCTDSAIQLGVIALCLFSLFLIIYKIIKDEQ